VTFRGQDTTANFVLWRSGAKIRQQTLYCVRSSFLGGSPWRLHELVSHIQITGDLSAPTATPQRRHQQTSHRKCPNNPFWTNPTQQSSSSEANSYSASQEVPHISWNPRFITVFTTARHLSIAWARLIQPTPSHAISLRSILLSCSHLRLDLSSGRVPSGLLTTTPQCNILLLHTCHVSRVPPNSFVSDKCYIIFAVHCLTTHKLHTNEMHYIVHFVGV
jgi:hypothetical protein